MPCAKLLTCIAFTILLRDDMKTNLVQHTSNLPTSAKCDCDDGKLAVFKLEICTKWDPEHWCVRGVYAEESSHRCDNQYGKLFLYTFPIDVRKMFEETLSIIDSP